MEWVNWSGSQRAAPAAIAQPRLARGARAGDRRRPGPVRVAGAGHSFSAGVVTDGTLLKLDALAPRPRRRRATGLVRVEAGIRLKALSRELHARGLAMPNLGDIDAQSLAGALATGTHGTGTQLPNLSGQVDKVELSSPTAASARSTTGELLRPRGSRSARSA